MGNWIRSANAPLASGSRDADLVTPSGSQLQKGEVAYHLFAYPAENNFDGSKCPLDWVQQVGCLSLGERPLIQHTIAPRANRDKSLASLGFTVCGGGIESRPPLPLLLLSCRCRASAPSKSDGRSWWTPRPSSLPTRWTSPSALPTLSPSASIRCSGTRRGSAP